MTPILFLVLSIILAALPPRPGLSAVGAAGAVLAALWAGTTLPDLDAWLGLGHRSGITHGPLLPLIALAAGPRWRPVAAGLMLGVGLHLAADTFPNAMWGYATVKLPGAGSIGAAASYWWLGLSAAALLASGAWLAARATPRPAPLLAAAGLLGAAYLLVTDGGWWALSALGLAGAGVARRRR